MPVALAPFREVASLLYEGAWVAERLATLEAFLRDAGPDDVMAVTRAIIEDGGRRFSAADAFCAMHRLAELRRSSEALWQRIDVLAVPTVPCFPTLAEVEADPVGPNARLGIFTNFVNLLGLAALAVPGPDRPDGLPAGITLIAPGGHDSRLVALGLRLAAGDVP